MKDSNVYRLPMAGPDDVSRLAELIDNGTVNPFDIVAIKAQTEGDAYSRGYSMQSFEIMLAEKMNITRVEVAARIPMLMIGFTGGLMSPHYNVFTRKEVDAKATGEKRFSIGVNVTRVLLPEEYGTAVQVRLVAEGVKKAMAEAGITDVADVHCVSIKCPAMTGPRLEDAASRGKTCVSQNTVEASSKAKGACALGGALGLGEIKDSDVCDEVICKDWSLYSNVTTTSAGNEQVACKILVLGNSASSASKLHMGSSVMKDTLDLQGAKAAFKSAGLKFDEVIPQSECDRIATVMINAGADAEGSIRGRRTTMKSDFLSSYQGIFAKAVINAVVGSLIGDTMILASAGFEHQGPHGANLVNAIVRVED
ncbi:MAG: ring-opening amidohydrolase [Oscillospiraceae bacterium]